MIIFMIMRWRMVKCARYLYLNIITTMVIIIFGEDSYDENENVKKNDNYGDADHDNERKEE